MRRGLRRPLLNSDKREGQQKMKGIVFVEFLDMVETSFSIATTEKLLAMSALDSQGIYTSVGTYSPKEMTTLVENLSQMTKIPVPVLLKEFGKHLFLVFAQKFPQFFKNINSTFEFLPRVHTFVHLEVKKLYDEAELPVFNCFFPDPDVLVMQYRSGRNLADMAEGLILGCAEYFKEDFDLMRETTDEDPPSTVFKLTRRKG
jgi:hypothetical protein